MLAYAEARKSRGSSLRYFHRAPFKHVCGAHDPINLYKSAKNRVPGPAGHFKRVPFENYVGKAQVVALDRSVGKEA